MKHRLFTSIALTGLITSTTLNAGISPEKDPNVNQINRCAPRASYFAFENKEKAITGNKINSNRFISIDGKWKFNWVKDADNRPLDFFKENYEDKHWSEINVPGNWELNGYGDPVYVNTGYAWRTQFDSKPPFIEHKNNHVGSYRRTINIPK